MTKKNTARFPRFGLKTFFLLFTIAGLMGGWLSQSSAEYQREQALLSELSKAAAEANGRLKIERATVVSPLKYAVM